MQIKSMMKEASFEIDLILVKGYDPLRGPRYRSPLQHLIKECDEKLRKARNTMHLKEQVHSIRCLVQCVLVSEDSIVSRSIKEFIRIIDGKKIKEACVKRKFGYKVCFIDIETRNAFSAKLTTALVTNVLMVLTCIEFDKQ